jgi:hypothetical protein
VALLNCWNHFEQSIKRWLVKHQLGGYWRDVRADLESLRGAVSEAEHDRLVAAFRASGRWPADFVDHYTDRKAKIMKAQYIRSACESLGLLDASGSSVVPRNQVSEAAHRITKLDTQHQRCKLVKVIEKFADRINLERRERKRVRFFLIVPYFFVT